MSHEPSGHFSTVRNGDRVSEVACKTKSRVKRQHNEGFIRRTHTNTHLSLHTVGTVKTGKVRLGLPEEDGALLSEETVNNTGGKALILYLSSTLTF